METTSGASPRRMDEEDEVHPHRLLLSHKKDEVSAVVTTGTDLPRVMLSEISKTEEEHKPCDFTPMWNINRNVTN